MENKIKIQIRNLWFYYKTRTVLENIHVDIQENTITSITGPSGKVKSTFLMTLNRLWQSIDGARVKGEVNINFGNEFKNIAFPLKLVGEKNKDENFQKVKHVLKKAFLWDEVKNRLTNDANMLSGGRQQRLCIARALVLKPQSLLLHEPTSSLDETSVNVIEQLLLKLKEKCTILLVSHYMDQVKRIADKNLVLSNRKLTQQQTNPNK